MDAHSPLWGIQVKKTTRVKHRTNNNFILCTINPLVYIDMVRRITCSGWVNVSIDGGGCNGFWEFIHDRSCIKTVFNTYINIFQ